MDKISMLFESIDAKVLTEEVKATLLKEVESLIESKAELKAKDISSKLEEQYSSALDEMFETVKKTIELDNESKFNEAVKVESTRISEEYATALKEDVESKLNEEIETFSEKLDMYATYAAQQFISENEAKWLQESEVAKANKIQEAFTNLAVGFGVSLSKITESTDVHEELEKAIVENKKLMDTVTSMKRSQVLEEMSKEFTAPQKDTFMKLVEDVLGEADEAKFMSRIEIAKMAVTTTKPVLEEKKEIELTKVDEKKIPSWKR